MDGASGHRRLLALAAAAALSLTFGAGTALATPAQDFTWSGQSNSPMWSAANWTIGQAPIADESLGTLTFPELASCNSSTFTCYRTEDDTPGLSSQHIDIDSSQGYSLTGYDSSFSLDLSAGITATADNSPSEYMPQISLPLVLSASQSWSLQGNGFESADYGGLDVHDVTGAGKSLAVKLSDSAHLNVTQYGEVLGRIETGALSITGTDTANAGLTSTKNGQVIATDLNGTNGDDVNLTRVTLLAEPRVTGLPVTTTVGALHVVGGELAVGAGYSPDALLKVKGGVSLDSKSLTIMTIDQGGSTASTDFPQIDSTAKIDLGGRLIVYKGGNAAGDCVLGTGGTATLVKTTGTLSGSFVDIPNGAVIPMVGEFQPADCSGPSTPIAALIHYTGDSVTAKVVPAKVSAVALLAASKAPKLGKGDTLTAKVTTGAELERGPAGVVAFRAGGKTIKGCGAVAVKASALAYATATCDAKFTKAQKFPLIAVFKPTSSSGVDGATSSSVAVVVAKK